jgi:HK97 family phage portal protein
MWPFKSKTIEHNVPSVQTQIAMAVKSITIPQAAPDWKLFAKTQTDWDVKTAIVEGYNASAAVYTCVEKRAKLVSSVPWKAKKKLQDGTLEDLPSSHPLNMLINMPNPETSWLEIMYEVSQQLDLAGNFFMSEIKAGARGLPTQVWVLPAQYVKIKPGKERLIDYYEYQESSSTRFKVMADDMVHLRLPNPSSRYFGQPVLMAAGRATDIDRESGIWQKCSLQNRGVLDISLEVPEGLQQDEIEAVQKKLEERHSSPVNARKPLVTSGKVTQLGQTAVEMDFVNSRKAVWAEICAVFGMSMSDLGFTESVNLANAEAMQKQLWVNTVIPQLELIKRQLNPQLASEFGPDICLEYDLSNVSALQENLTEKLTNAEKLWRLGFSLEAINSRLELGFDSDQIPEEPDLIGEEPEAETVVVDDEMKRLLKSVCYGK